MITTEPIKPTKKTKTPGIWSFANPVICAICQQPVVQSVAIRKGKEVGKNHRKLTTEYICAKHTLKYDTSVLPLSVSNRK